MSLNRLIFYSAMIGGWAAFVGWFLSELLLFRRSFPDGWWGFVVIMLAVASLPAVAGGLLGGRIPREGGQQDQIRMAAVCGALAAVPFACFILWSLTGR